MNQKRKYKAPGEVNPTYLHRIDIDYTDARGRIVGAKLVPHTMVRVRKRTGLVAGEYTFLYAEIAGDVTLIYAERYGMRKTLLVSDIKGVREIGE